MPYQVILNTWPRTSGSRCCVASRVIDSSVIVTTRSTSASSTARGAPGLGPSRRPSHPLSMNRRRHLPTVSRVVPSQAGTPASLSPPADASTIRARSPRACPVLERRSPALQLLPLSVVDRRHRPRMVIRHDVAFSRRDSLNGYGRHELSGPKLKLARHEDCKETPSTAQQHWRLGSKPRRHRSPCSRSSALRHRLRNTRISLP